MKNIEILVAIKESAEKANLIIEDIEQKMELEGVELADLISAEDKDVCSLISKLNDINIYIHMLTEEVQTYMKTEVISRDMYSEWYKKIIHDPMRLVGLMESFEEKHTALISYISEIIRDYRILTQEGYGSAEE